MFCIVICLISSSREGCGGASTVGCFWGCCCCWIGGIGWELLKSMVRYKARQRLSAKAALAHPYFVREGLLALSFMQTLRLQLLRATQQDYSEAARWVIQLMAKSGTQKDGGFTEAQLQELRVCVLILQSLSVIFIRIWIFSCY